MKFTKEVVALGVAEGILVPGISYFGLEVNQDATVATLLALKAVFMLAIYAVHKHNFKDFPKDPPKAPPSVS